ncbi:hypothetical protein CDAR_602221 [Caerostris darwini]|uniref:Uncharacterized protein n=1 Tax=Caerostris darwini TaxID=1538125 RepID=A0AAV4N954_9ARAC|nr:hypothetical protein CDAR_602221 [Caerostris darwini]
MGNSCCFSAPCYDYQIRIHFVAGEDAAPSWLPGARFSPCLQNEFINCLHSSLARALFFHVPPSPLALCTTPNPPTTEYDIRKEAGDASLLLSQRTVFGYEVC